MSNQPGKGPQGKPRPSLSAILGTITPENAVTILRHLADSDAEIAKRIEYAMTELFSGVDVDEVASQVQWELESLSVDDL